MRAPLMYIVQVQGLCTIIFLYRKAFEEKRNIILLMETSNISKQITANVLKIFFYSEYFF